MEEKKMENKKKDLEKKIIEAEIKMPGVSKHLEDYRGGAFDLYWTGSTEDVKCLETERYQIVAAKREEHIWLSGYNGSSGVGWESWLSLYYKEKSSEGEIKELETERIVTRDKYDGKKDKRYLWSFSFVGAEKLGESQIELAWTNAEGKKGPTYMVDLETQKLIEKKI